VRCGVDVYLLCGMAASRRLAPTSDIPFLESMREVRDVLRSRAAHIWSEVWGFVLREKKVT
jgi:hypothetical protein